MCPGKSPRKAFTPSEFDRFDPYRSLGIIHGEPGEPNRICSAELPVNNSGAAMIAITNIFCAAKLLAGFAARPGRRMTAPKTFDVYPESFAPGRRLLPDDEYSELFACSCSDEFYKGFAGRSQVGSLAKSTEP